MKLAADLHVHTVASGHAYSTLLEYVEEAKKIGLKGFAITDHGPAMPGGPHWYHFSNMGMIPEKIKGIRVYRGVEANIINPKGEIDLPNFELEKLDIVMAAMHPRTGYENLGEDENTRVLERALKNPYINVIAHPGNPKYPIKVEETVALAKEKRVAIEVNNSSFTSRVGSWERCVEFAREVKRQDWMIVIGSDSHITTMLGRFENAFRLIKEAGLTEKHVVNTSLAKIDKYLINR